jgi:signal transduction histidine kinase
VNAIEAMGAEGELTLSTERTTAEDPRAAGTPCAGQAGLLVRVADTGPGISAESRRHLFEPFYTTKPNGTGLGLAITRRIVRENGGEIRLDSAPGQGCVFSLWFPPTPAV